MDIINTKADAYAKRYSSPLDNVRAQNEEITMTSHSHAGMHSGHVQGKFLEMISIMLKPGKVLEIGTFTGFSALCLVKGLAADGVLHTIELRADDAAFAANFFNKAGIADRIIQHVGDARQIIPGLHENWDLVFIDADKVSYIEYYELTLPFLKSGGWIIADNVLFHGEVLEEEIKGKNALAIQAFNDHVAADKRVEQVILTLRDGIMLIRKL